MIRALSPVNRFLHACYHAALGDWPLRLASLRDIAEMVCSAELDGEVLIRRAVEWSAEAVMAAAIADTWRLLGIATTDELSSWAQRYTPSQRELARLALYTHTDKTFAAQALATLRVIPRLRDKAAYLRALILPEAQYTAGRALLGVGPVPLRHSRSTTRPGHPPVIVTDNRLRRVA